MRGIHEHGQGTVEEYGTPGTSAPGAHMTGDIMLAQALVAFGATLGTAASAEAA